MRRGLLLIAKLLGRLAVSLAAFLAGLSAAKLPAPRAARPPAPCEATRDSLREAAPDESHAPQSWPAPSFTPSVPDLQLSPEALRAAWQISATPGLLLTAAQGAGDGQGPCACGRGGEIESR